MQTVDTRPFFFLHGTRREKIKRDWRPGYAHTCMHINSHTHTHTNFIPPPQIPLKLPLLILSWRRGPDMSFGMHGYVQSVVVEGTVYVGGGFANDGNDYIVMTYDISTGKWATLPQYRARAFAMTAINNQLVLVGGYIHDRSKMVAVWDADNRQWTHPYPEMHTARSSCSVVVYRAWLVVAGGVPIGSDESSSVEVMNTNSKQWYAGPPTPTLWSHMRTAVVGDMCYFMGGAINRISTDKVYAVSLSALTSGLTSNEPKKNKNPKWSEISGLQLADSTLFSISGSLLAVGGKNKDRKAVPAIHLYKPDIGEWVKVGDLPTPRRDCVCAMITDKEMLVAGGYDGINILKSTDIALLK